MPEEYFDFVPLFKGKHISSPDPWVVEQVVNSKAGVTVVMCLHRYSAFDRSGISSTLFRSPQPPLELLRDWQYLSPRAEMLISDQTQAQFKAVLGAALKKSCSGCVTLQDTHPGFPGSKGSRSHPR